MSRTSHIYGFLLVMVVSYNCQEIPSDVSDLANINTDFGLRLYREIAEGGRNVFLSPYSISVALSMLYRGADGNTKDEMTEVLGFDPDSNVHSNFKLLHDILFGRNKNYTLTEANKIFSRKDYTLLEDFQSDLETNYGAPVELLDFQENPEPSREHINKWVADQTEQIIRDLLQPGSIDSSTVMVLVNAIYFKGLWKDPFKANKTRGLAFHINSGTSTKVDMMHHFGLYGYTESTDLDCQVLELPYAGDDVAMYIFLPNEIEGLENLEDDLNAEKINQAISELNEVKVRIQIPKFTITHHLSLTDVLEELGIEEVFSDDADLSRIDGSENLKVSDVVHQAFVEVNEEGTEAAGATGIIVNTKSASPSPEFIADHPFMFLIRYSTPASSSEHVKGNALVLNPSIAPSIGISVRVNEEGTEAAGATAIIAAVKSMPLRFIADHPFMFLIREKSTGSTLFMGRVKDPTTTYMARRSAPSSASHDAYVLLMMIISFFTMILLH